MTKQTAQDPLGFLPAESDPGETQQWAVKSVGGGLMIAAAVLATGVTVLVGLRHQPIPPFTRTANYLLSTALAVFGLFLLRTPRHLPTWLVNTVPITAAILICVPNCADKAPVELGPLLLTWPVAYSTAALSTRAAWSTVGASGAVFALVVSISHVADGVLVWIEGVCSMIVICWMVVCVQNQAHRLRRTLTDLARTDPLTRLLNRRAFDEALAHEHTRNHRGGPPMALLLVDIDHFKHVNDTWGHQAGDATLRRLGKLLTETFRPADVVGRIGGEEFAVLIPDCDPEQAARRAHELCSTVRTVTHHWEHPITISVGIASHPEAAATPTEVFAMADSSLYAAKTAGRDRVGEDSMPPSRGELLTATSRNHHASSGGGRTTRLT